MEKIIYQIEQNIIKINYDFDEIQESNISDAEKVMKLSYLVGQCIGYLHSKKIDLINLKENGNGKN